MKTGTSRIAIAVAASCFALAVPAVAASTAKANLPAVHRAGAVTYLSGGVGQTEAEAMKHVAKYYPLELEFLRKAKPRDEYLSDVEVRIKDAQNKMVLDVTSDGPFLLARMPAGKYTVSVEHNGKLENRVVQIAPQEHRRLVFEWRA